MTRPPNKRVSRGKPVRRGGQPAKPTGCRGPVTMAIAVIAVGVIGLTTHYWLAYLPLIALSTKAWRAAA